MLAWKSGFWQTNFLLPVYVPTSSNYEKGRLANPGLNYWTLDPAFGASYNNDKIGFNAASTVAPRSMPNCSIRTTRAAPPCIWTEASSDSCRLARIPRHRRRSLLPGAGRRDSGRGARLGDFMGRTAGVGPVLSYILPRGKETFVAELRWLPELDVKNRLEGGTSHLVEVRSKL